MDGGIVILDETTPIRIEMFHHRPQFLILFIDVFSIDLNADVTLVTVPPETQAS